MFSTKALRIAGLATGLIAVVAGIFAWTSPVSLSGWRAHRYVARANAFLKAELPQTARLAATRALRLNKNSAEAVRIMLETTPATDLQSAMMFRCRLADLDPKDQKNLQRLVLAGIATRSFTIAATAIQTMIKLEGENAATDELGARLALAEGRYAEAASHARALLKRNPGNPAGRLIFALARINSEDEKGLAEVERELTDLLSVKQIRLEALRGLQNATIRDKKMDRAIEVSELLVAEPDAEFRDWLARAAIVVKVHPERMEVELEKLTEHARNDERAFGSIATWLRSIGQLDQIELWAKNNVVLQQHRVTSETIRAQAMIAGQKWAELAAMLRNSDWEKLDFLRQLYLARALNELNKGSYFKENQMEQRSAWLAAKTGALVTPESTRMLADTMRDWPGWERDYVEFLWEAQRTTPLNLVWSLSELFRRYEAQQDTSSLLRVTEAMLASNPANVFAKNKVAFYSLLLDSQTNRAHVLARELFAAFPDNSSIVPTYALSLLKLNRARELVAVLEKLRPEVLRSDAVAPYYALALGKVRRSKDAAKAISNVDRKRLLPEEREMLDSAGLQGAAASRP